MATYFICKHLLICNSIALFWTTCPHTLEHSQLFYSKANSYKTNATTQFLKLSILKAGFAICYVHTYLGTFLLYQINLRCMCPHPVFILISSGIGYTVSDWNFRVVVYEG